MKNRYWTNSMIPKLPSIAAAALLALAALASPSFAETDPGIGAVDENGEEISLSTAELNDLIGPIALYPDDLVSIVLPAAAYPLQIVEAARFIEDRKSDNTLQPDEEWDDSVIALLNYPEVVELLNEDLQWTWTLGEAFVQQQEALLAAVEDFRAQAHDAGNLKSDSRQTVTRDDDAIEIEPADPEVIYVPYYEPAEVVVYHTVPAYYYYPRPRPVYYYPYPSNYNFASGYFFGVSTAYRLHWGHHRLFTHHYWHNSHPYFGRSYYRPHYSRHYQRHGSWNAHRSAAYHSRGYGAWQPGWYRNQRPAYRNYRPRQYTQSDRRHDRPRRVRQPESRNNVYTDRNRPRSRPQLQGPRNDRVRTQPTTAGTGKERVRARRPVDTAKPRRHPEQQRAPEPGEREVAALLQQRDNGRLRGVNQERRTRDGRRATPRSTERERVTTRRPASEPRSGPERVRPVERPRRTSAPRSEAPRVTRQANAPRNSGQRVARTSRNEPERARSQHEAPRKTDKKAVKSEQATERKGSKSPSRNSRATHMRR